jgi:lipopolysaccharide export system permease protein
LRLYSGETFEHLKESGDNKRPNKVIPYRRETFAHKEIVIDYDANFNELDPGFLEQQYVSKNTQELMYAVDSIDKRLARFDSTAMKRIKTTTYFNRNQRTAAESIDTTNITAQVDTIVNPKKQYLQLSDYYKKMVINTALTRSRVVQSDIVIRKNDVEWLKTEQRRHTIEWHKRHTLPFACLIFLFIGAPLGAIIRKGGMGMPLVMSVVLFICYYIIDNTGYKLARDGVWPVWQGIWLSSAVLLPLGVFLTSRATKDSAVLNLDLYADFFRHIFGRDKVRRVEHKEIVMKEMSMPIAEQKAQSLTEQCQAYLSTDKGMNYISYWMRGYNLQSLRNIATSVESLVTYTADTTNNLITTKLMDYPILAPERILAPSGIKPIDIILMVLVPIGLPIYLIAKKKYKNLKHNIEVVCNANNELIVLLQRAQKSE